ncbi:MAG: hypothetical protein AVDCRST_MAG10-835 [uncultured Acidimicrobiales bacterium]|uniref:Uncharacterized protein n=1 Tax=uncultured Acidimicrobiales bacterium TaxID=310071 RepID=A0A6J4HIM2_9ACTN|nr:MAG: hypothetical protein AVDCRST_MAG10-835 [uncultured Acidimicrobiales bacterium]
MRLTLGSRSYDLRTRALVMAVAGSPREGADIVHMVEPGPAELPVCVTACDEDGVRRALAAGVDLLHLSEPTPASLSLCADAATAVLVPPAAAADAAAAGLPPERIVVDALLLDVTTADLPAVVTAVGVIQGARIVRTADVAGARRVCDVLAAVLEAP